MKKKILFLISLIILILVSIFIFLKVNMNEKPINNDVEYEQINTSDYDIKYTIEKEKFISLEITNKTSQALKISKIVLKNNNSIMTEQVNDYLLYYDTTNYMTLNVPKISDYKNISFELYQIKGENIKIEEKIEEPKRVIYNYKCTKQLYKNEDYMVYSTIGFSIDNENTILSGVTDSEYYFVSKKSFDEFDVSLGINARPIIKNNSKKYIRYSYSYFEEKKENETKDEYISRLEELGYKCELEK